VWFIFLDVWHALRLMKYNTVSMMAAGLFGLVGNVGAYEMHEWGTFTTLSGSDGKLLSGMQVEEERLPHFVLGHQGVMPLIGKGMMRPLKNVTVKMETPVIYFYGDDREHVNVKVGFDGGTISQWFPQRTSGDVLPKLEKLNPAGLNDPQPIQAMMLGGQFVLPGYKELDFGVKYHGEIEWDTEIIPRDMVDSSKYFRSGETTNWIYPQVPDSNIVKVGDTYEQYLFYRGLGNFELPMSLTVDEAETLKIDYKGKERVPFALAYEMKGSEVRYKLMKGGLDSSSPVSIKDDDGWVELKRGREADSEVYRLMRDGLIAQGLTDHEANGMVKTWWRSYFQHDGLRVFWVLPQGDVERILPMTLSPKAESKVRVIVGRSEVLRPRFERKLLAESKKKKKSYFQFGRYGLAYEERVRALTSSVNK